MCQKCRALSASAEVHAFPQGRRSLLWAQGRLVPWQALRQFRSRLHYGRPLYRRAPNCTNKQVFLLLRSGGNRTPQRRGPRAAQVLVARVHHRATHGDTGQYHLAIDRKVFGRGSRGGGEGECLDREQVAGSVSGPGDSRIARCALFGKPVTYGDMAEKNILCMSAISTADAAESFWLSWRS